MMITPGAIVRWHSRIYCVSALEGDHADLYSHSITYLRRGGFRRTQCEVYGVPLSEVEALPPKESHRIRRKAAAKPLPPVPREKPVIN